MDAQGPISESQGSQQWNELGILRDAHVVHEQLHHVGGQCGKSKCVQAHIMRYSCYERTAEETVALKMRIRAASDGRAVSALHDFSGNPQAKNAKTDLSRTEHLLYMYRARPASRALCLEKGAYKSNDQ